MARRILFGGTRVATVADTLPVVMVRDAIYGQPTRAQSILRTYRTGAMYIVPRAPVDVCPGARLFSPCGYDGEPFRDPATPPATPPLAPPVTLDVVEVGDLPLGTVVLALEPDPPPPPAPAPPTTPPAPWPAWSLGAVVGDATQVEARTVGGPEGKLLALGRRVTWVPVLDLQGATGAAIFAGGRAAPESNLYPFPAVALDAYLPSGRVRLRGFDGTTFEAPGMGMLESFDLPLPDPDGRVWIIQAADLSTVDPDPDPGEAFVCVHPSCR